MCGILTVLMSVPHLRQRAQVIMYLGRGIQGFLNEHYVQDTIDSRRTPLKAVSRL